MQTDELTALLRHPNAFIRSLAVTFQQLAKTDPVKAAAYQKALLQALDAFALQKE